MGIPPGLQLRIAPSSPRVSSTLGIGSWNPVYGSLSHIRCLVKRKIDHSRLLLFYTFTKAKPLLRSNQTERQCLDTSSETDMRLDFNFYYFPCQLLYYLYYIQKYTLHTGNLANPCTSILRTCLMGPFNSQPNVVYYRKDLRL